MELREVDRPCKFENSGSGFRGMRRQAVFLLLPEWNASPLYLSFMMLLASQTSGRYQEILIISCRYLLVHLGGERH